MRRRCAVCRNWFTARADAVTCSDRCRTARNRQIRALTPPWPEGGPFDLALVDLPFRFTAYSAKGEGRSPQRHYPTLDIPALIQILVPMFRTVLAKNCVGAWWVYGTRPSWTMLVMQACGFVDDNELLIWIKTRKTDGEPTHGLGLTTRKIGETMWSAKRGQGLPIHDKNVRGGVFTYEELPLVVAAPRRKPHSRKPDEAYHALERLYGPCRRLDVFGRYQRPGWTVWGNELL